MAQQKGSATARNSACEPSRPTVDDTVPLFEERHLIPGGHHRAGALVSDDVRPPGHLATGAVERVATLDAYGLDPDEHFVPRHGRVGYVLVSGKPRDHRFRNRRLPSQAAAYRRRPVHASFTPLWPIVHNWFTPTRLTFTPMADFLFAIGRRLRSRHARLIWALDRV